MDQLEGLEELTEIGRGGFGVVYKAVETDLNRTVAVKVLNEASADLAAKRLDRERRAMGVLSGHPNIVTIYRTGMTGGSPYLVMEFLGGGSLADRVLHGPPIAWQEAVNIGTALADAIDAAHRAGVLHRDIKPANVLLSDTGVPKLGDFGIANVEAVSQTSGVMKATVAHAPPEVLSGQEGDVRADVYSLASTIYELIVGRPAFVRPEDTSPVPVMMRITSEPVPDIDPALCPPAVTRCLQQTMAKDPAHRPASAADFRELLIAATHNPNDDRSGGLAGMPPPGQPSPAAASGGQQTIHALAPDHRPDGRPIGPPGVPANQPGRGAPGVGAPPPSGPAQNPAAFHNTGATPPPGLARQPSGPVGFPPPGQFNNPGPGSTGGYGPPGAPPGYQPAPFQSSGPTPLNVSGQVGPSRSGNSTMLIVGGVIAALIVIGGAALLLTRGDGDDPDVQTAANSGGDSTETTAGSDDGTTTETTAAETTTTSTTTTTLPPSTAPLIDTSTVAGRTEALRLIAARQLVSSPGFAELPTYPGGVTPFTDNGGVITGEAPIEWGDRRDAAIVDFSHGVQVATDLAGTNLGTAESGVVVFIYDRDLIANRYGSAGHDDLIATIITENQINCSQAPNESFTHPLFTGRYTILTSCVDSDPDLMGLYLVGTLNQDPQYLLQVTLLTSDPQSVAAAQAALDSIQINLANLTYL